MNWNVLLKNTGKRQKAYVIFSGIEKTSSVCGGSARIAGRRIPVWLLEQAHRLGSDDADLLRAFPALCVDDLANAWAYVHLHQEEIETEIHANETA